MKLSAWHYIAIGMLILNTGITIGGFVAQSIWKNKFIQNHIKHINETLARIEKKVCANDARIDDHAQRIARVEERTNKRG